MKAFPYNADWYLMNGMLPTPTPTTASKYISLVKMVLQVTTVPKLFKTQPLAYFALSCPPFKAKKVCLREVVSSTHYK
jgi:hypothetical protein